MKSKNVIKHFVTTDRLPKHDLFFGTPSPSPDQGIPIGDGDTGSLIWGTEDELHVLFNKTDLWDDAENDSEVFCSGDEENITCLRHGAEMVLHFNSPCFHIYYQKDYAAKLTLADATASVHSQTPFSEFDMRAFASHVNRTTVLSCSYASSEAEELSISLSRWGSRNFWRGHYQMLDAPEKGLDGTCSEVEENRLLICQQLNGRAFCVGVEVINDEAMVAMTKGNHQAVTQGGRAREHHVTLYCNVSVAATTEQAKAECIACLQDAVTEGEDALYARHSADWMDFWNRSYVAIPQDYVENLYYLSLYYSNSECRGVSPPHFTTGIWSFQKDYMPWSYYFHYNMQHMYAPLDAAGHGELTEGFYRMRRDQLETAKKFAKEVKGRRGAFYHDVTDRFGRGATYDGENSSCGAQIAMAMWKHYRYSGDEKFFKDVAYPVMEAAAEYYCDLLQKGSDGLYHTHETSAYEANPPCTDTITDLAMMKALFGVMVKITEGETQARYREILEHLTEPILVPLDEDDWDGKVFTYGRGKGKIPADGNCVLAMGRNASGEPWRKSFGNPNSTRNTYGFPDVELSLIYPSSVIGLSDRGTPVFNALLNHLMIHGEADSCMNWCMMPIYLARMGKAEELDEYWKNYISQWQIYPNGMNADGPAAISWTYDLRYRTRIGEVKTKQIADYPAYIFRHFDFESTPILAASVNEALLQSYDGILRICPAIPAADRVVYTLYAEGGFRVEADVDESSCGVLVESLRGESLSVVLPKRFDINKIYVYKQRENGAWERIDVSVGHRVGEAVFILGETQRGDRFYLSNVEETPEEQILRESYPSNAAMKLCGDACLGSVGVLH